MKTERDYLFYALPPSADRGNLPEQDSTKNSAVEGSHGLCWLTYQLDQDERDGPSGSQDRNTSVAPDSMDSVIPNFFHGPPSHQILNVVRDNVVPFLRQDLVSQRDRYVVIWNDRAGRGLAKLWLDRVILPILNFSGLSTHQIQIYQSWQEFDDQPLLVKEAGDEIRPRVIILGGDGTVSDFLNRLFHQSTTDDQSIHHHQIKKLKARFDLVIIPLGTANAMFYSLHPELKQLTRPRDILIGLMSLLLEPTRRSDGLAEPLPMVLPLACVETKDSNENIIDHYVSFVVVSTALHASILHTANELTQRPEYQFKGIQVFKDAFKLNVSKTWKASVKLLPTKFESNDSIELYDPKINQFSCLNLNQINDDHHEDDEDRIDVRGIDLDGSFTYFTSCLIDRLESNFLITPLRKDLMMESRRSDEEDDKRSRSESRLRSTIDLVIMRTRFTDDSIQLVDKQSQDFNSTSSQDTNYNSKLLENTFQSVYQNGTHINLLTHDLNGKEIPIVEYYRCGGWIWKPIDQESEHEVCIDGKTIKIPIGGMVKFKMMKEELSDIRVY